MIKFPGAIPFKSLFSVWLEKPARRAILLAGVVILIFLTLMAAMPINVTGPFDARTYEPVRDVRLDYSPAGAVFEPVTALAHIITESPDIRTACYSLLFWVLGLSVCIAVVRQLKGNQWRVSRRIITVSVAAAVRIIFWLVLYGTFAVLVRIPNWHAIARDPDIVLVELQTHTFGSSDGLISARDNLRWHGRRGCSVVAVTEHLSPKGSLEAATLAESDESLPAVLPGVEINPGDSGYLVAIAAKEQFLQHPFDSSKKPFISSFHQTYEGIVLSLKAHLKVEMVEQLADAGIDGFEVANDGHPDTSANMLKEVLAVADSHRLPLIAWSDWHGIGGILRTWTAIRIPNAADLSRQQRATAVLETLRRHDCSKITPLVIGRFGQVSLARAIFSPFTETVRYAFSLSPARVLAWWIWAVLLFLVSMVLLHLGIRPVKMILAVVLITFGIAILINSARLIIAYISGQAAFFFPMQVGLEASALALAAITFGVVDAFFAVRRRQVKPV
jgi:hypothetical protein